MWIAFLPQSLKPSIARTKVHSGMASSKLTNCKIIQIKPDIYLKHMFKSLVSHTELIFVLIPLSDPPLGDGDSTPRKKGIVIGARVRT